MENRIEIQGINWNLIPLKYFTEEQFASWLESQQNQGNYSKKLDAKKIWSILYDEFVKRGWKPSLDEEDSTSIYDSTDSVDSSESNDFKPRSVKKKRNRKNRN